MRSFLVALALLFLACCQNADSWHHRHGSHKDRQSRHHADHHKHGSHKNTQSRHHADHHKHGSHKDTQSRHHADHHGHGSHKDTQSGHHADHHLRYSKVKGPSGVAFDILNPHASKFPCQPSAKVTEIDDKGIYKDEYEFVSGEFSMTDSDGRDFILIKVEKVFNGCWLQRYNYRQKQIKHKLPSNKHIYEILLYHGTSRAEIVAQKGFNAKKGAGLYFEDDIPEAHKRTKPNSQGLRKMIMGRVTQPVSKGKHPFVIYQGEQAYPDYIITYIVEME